jgi:hypothetical protein
MTLAAPAWAQAAAAPEGQAAPAAAAQTEAAATPATAEAAPVPPGMARLAAMTPVAFEFVEPLSSNLNKNDDMFPIRLIAPIRAADGTELVPAGTMGQGQVVQAAKSGWGGKAGELTVAVRFIDYKGVHIPLRRFRMGGIGEDRTSNAFAVGMVVPLATFFMNGGEKTIVVGTRGNAIVSADTDIPADPAIVAATDAPTSN